MDKLPISVIIISSNAKNKIRTCLNSVYGWVNEIVVVVNDCTDGTDEIAANDYGAKVFKKNWAGYRDQKNFAKECAQCDWVLNLDTDEAVSEKLKNAIFEFFKNNEDAKYSGVINHRRQWYFDRWIDHGDWYPDKSIRLFKKNSGKWIGGSVHENVEVIGSLKTINADLEHYAFSSISDYIKRNVKYAELSANDKAKRKLSTPKLMLYAITRPAWTFFKGYFLKRGFLDGFAGFCVAIQCAFITFLKYVIAYELSKKQ